MPNPIAAPASRSITVTFDDGSQHVYRNAPGDVTPEQVTERAESEFGKSVVHLDGGRKSSPSGQQSPPATPVPTPTPDARSVVESIFPGVKVTDWKRPADSPLGRENPNSWHVRSGGAVDVHPLPGMTFNQYVSKIKAAGYPIIEARDEVANPVSYATGPHWHVTIGAKAANAQASRPAQELHSGTHPPALDGVPLSPVSAGNRPAPEHTGKVGASALGFADALTFGLGDEIDAGIGAILGGPGYHTVWEGNGPGAAYDANVKRNRELLGEAQSEHPYAYGGGAVAGSLVPITGTAGGAVKAAKALDKLKAASKAGAAYGAAYGFGSDTGNPLERLDGALEGAGIGAVTGAGLHGAVKTGEAVLSPLARKLLPQLAEAQFARQQAGNPHVVTDANVADDLDKLVQTMMVDGAKRKLSKTQQATFLNRVAHLEASYMPSDEVKALDLPPSVKARLNTAMARRHLLSDEEVQALHDGSPAGEAVANGIEKARRLRAYVSEASGSTGGAGRVLAEALGSAAGWKAAGPVGGALGGRIGRAAVSRSEGQAAKDAVALADKAKLFAKLPEVSAAREAAGDTDSLSRMSADALDAPYNARKAAEQEAARLETEGRKVAVANARDDVKPSGGWRGLIYERTGLLPSQQDAGALTALKDGAISQEQFDAYLDDPSKLMAGNAGNALMDRLGDMADKGKLKRDENWEPSKPTEGRAALQAAYDAADQRWREALDADVAEFEATGADRLHRSHAADVDSSYAEREAARQALDRADVRNPIAYRATAQGNQRRVSDALSAVHSRDDLADADRETIATAIATIGNTSSREKAQGIASDALDRLSANQRGYAQSILSPLVQQIRR